MRINAELESKVIDGKIKAKIQVTIHGGFAIRGGCATITNIIGDGVSSMTCENEAHGYQISAKCVEAFINPFMGEGYHRYVAEVTATSGGETLSTMVSTQIKAVII